MIKPTMFTGMSAAVLFLATLGGCSSTKNPGEIMQNRGSGTTELGEQWTDGERMMRESEAAYRERGKTPIQ